MKQEQTYHEWLLERIANLGDGLDVRRPATAAARVRVADFQYHESPQTEREWYTSFVTFPDGTFAQFAATTPAGLAGKLRANGVTIDYAEEPPDPELLFCPDCEHEVRMDDWAHRHGMCVQCHIERNRRST